MTERDAHHTSLVIGRKNVGKSTYTAGVGLSYPKAQKVLIFDVNGSPAYNSYPSITPKDIPRLKAGKAKIIGVPTLETLDITAKHFRGGLIVFEDCTKYISGAVHPSIKTFLVDHRMYQCDLIFTFHSIYRVPPFFWEMTSYCTLFKTAETFGTEYRKRIPNYDVMFKAFEILRKSSDEHKHLTVKTLI